jgi:hypothetical protein
MQFSFTLLAVLHLTHALHIRPEARNTRLKALERSTQDAASTDLIQSHTTDAVSTQKRKKPIPWWKLPNTDNGEMNALTGQQFYPFEDEDDNSGSSDDTDGTADTGICFLTQCENSGVLNKDYCGPHARCLEGYCRCNLGWKPESNVAAARGWTGLEALTVWADNTYTGCSVRCESLSCSEVPQVMGCFGVPAKDSEENDNAESSKELATDSLQLGAIKAPGADAGIGQAA